MDGGPGIKKGTQGEQTSKPTSKTIPHTQLTNTKVLRYSALGLGVLYGFYHQRSLTAAQKAAEAQREYEHKQKLINQAKQAYAKTKQPAVSTSATQEGEFSLFQIISKGENGGENM
jgi:F-type H+-transporting ATP synthase subunit e